MKVLWVALPLLAVMLFIWCRTMVDMPLRSHAGPLPPLTGEEEALAGRLSGHVEALAAGIGERNLWHHEALLESARYIGRSFAGYGLTVSHQEYRVGGRAVANVEAEIRSAMGRGKIVLVGAHYDSVRGSPGANDNASGVAALLELGRLLAGEEHGATVRLVAFVNEEPPFFQTEEMGSLVYARRSRKRGENLIAVLSLETIGSYSDEPGSQGYPPPFGAFYPDRGNFIAFVGNISSGGLVRRCLGSFRRHTAFPSQGIAAPGVMMGVGWSDHWSFWREGYRAIMVTDTALFRYGHYHGSTDTPEKLDYQRMARVVAGLARVVADLAASGEQEGG